MQIASRTVPLDANGQIGEMVGMNRDITARAQAEEGSQTSRDDLDRAQEVGKIGSWRLDVRQNVLSWSNENYRIFGVPNGTPMTYEGFLAIVHPDDRADVDAKWQAALRGEPYDIEHRLLVDGHAKWVRERAYLEFDAAGALLGGFGVTQDITERKEAELALRESQRQLALALEAGQLGFWDWDVPSGRVQFGGIWAAMLGYDPSEVDPHVQAWQKLVHPDEREAVAARLSDHLEGRSDIYECEHRLRHKDGSWRWILDRGRVVERDVEGRPLRMIGTHADVTIRHEAEEALREADRRKDEFIATLAHELRNPLTPIHNAAHILQIKQGPDGKDAALFDMIQRHTAHLVRLVDDLLEISRISLGKINLRRQNVDMASVLRDALETCRLLVDEKGHLLTVKVATEPLLVFGDPVRLAQILANLIGNAAKYTPPGGRIEIDLGREGEAVVFRIRDNGVGIEPRLIPQIFEVFTQTGPHSRLSSKGLGIGLSVVRKLTDLQGGSVAAHSEGIGKGSEFIVRLPLVLGAEPARLESASPGGPSLAEGPRRVMVIDDDPDVGGSLGVLLESLGARVRVCPDGLAGVAAIRDFQPEIVFIDLGMPGVDGYETARRIRRLPDGEKLTLIALTGWDQSEHRRRSLEAGFDLHLAKPASIDAIEKLLQGADARRG